MSIKSLFFALVVLLSGCGVDTGGDGTGPAVLGTLTEGLREAGPQVHIAVAGFIRSVDIDDDAFLAEDLMEGDVTIVIEAGDMRGEVLVRDAERGELIEVEARRDADTLVIEVTRRVQQRPEDPEHEHGDDDIVLAADDLHYEMRAGVHDGDLIITGDDIKVKGTGCATVVTGDLIIEGSHVEVKYVHVLGRIRVADDVHDVKIKNKKHCDHHHGHHDRDHGHRHDDHHHDHHRH